MEPRVLLVRIPALTVGALTWGPAEGPLALLLHGFPDTAWTWRHVAPRLAEDGWRVVAPFSRGYAPTDRPAGGRYSVGALASDVLALHTALGGGDDALLVGHDWGALTVYAVAAAPLMPFARTVALSVPPLPAIQQVMRGRTALRLTPRQARSSWYVGLNQLPGVSERAFAPLAGKLWRDWSPGYDAAEDLAHLARALPTRAHRTAALSYYRDLARPWRGRGVERGPRPDGGPGGAWSPWPGVPTLYLHGARDGALLPELGERAGATAPAGSRSAMIEGAGHFVQLERPDAVVHYVRQFTTQFGAQSTARSTPRSTAKGTA